MKILWKRELILAAVTVLLLSMLSMLPQSTKAANSIPFYNGGTRILSPILPGGPILGRVDKTIGINPLLGEMRYPTIYDGRIGGSSKASINSTFKEPWMGSIQAYQG